MNTAGIDLGGLRVTLKKPRVVAERSHGRCWYPDLLKFSTGELMLNHSLNADRNDNLHDSQAVYLSTDEGRSFDITYDVNGFHNSGGEPRISLADGRIVGPSSFFKLDRPQSPQRFRTHYWNYSQGGRRYCVEPWSVVVEGLPGPVGVGGDPSGCRAQMNGFGDILVCADNSWLSTLSITYMGEKRASIVTTISHDEGRSWRYLSTVAVPDDAPTGIEGFGEPCLVRLADGDVMCIMRVGQHQKQPDQWLRRAYSSDEGRSWSALDILTAYSVAPQVCRLDNDVLLLSTGRPGIFLWLSADGRGAQWSPVDIVDWHNQALDEPSHIKIPAPASTGIDPLSARKGQTTSYTAMVEVSLNRIFLVYDRAPLGWQALEKDSGERSQIYLLEAEIQRTE
jgi:hypothetical protein